MVNNQTQDSPPDPSEPTEQSVWSSYAQATGAGGEPLGAAARNPEKCQWFDRLLSALDIGGSDVRGVRRSGEQAQWWGHGRMGLVVRIGGQLPDAEEQASVGT